MNTWRTWRKRILAAALPVTALGLLLFGASAPVAAQTPNGYWWWERTIETIEAGIAHPIGIAFLSGANEFLVVNGNGRAVTISSYGERLRATRLTISGNALNLAFDEQTQRLLWLDENRTLQQFNVKANGELDTRAEHSKDKSFGNQAFQAQGITLNSKTGQVWILDGAARRVLRADSDARVSQLDLTFASEPLRGLAFNPTDQHLYALSAATSMLYEFTQKGKLVAVRDLSELRLRTPQALLFAPSGDNTDDPTEQSLYIAESGAKARPGGIVEISLTPPLVEDLPESTSASLVRLTVTGNWSPRSPDPAGVVYVPDSNRLLISDSEVEEMPNYFVGKNMFEATLGGALTRTFTTFTSNPTGLAWNNYSKEPTGLGYNPNNEHLFVSDDSKKKIFEVNPGNDDVLGTSDDVVTSFSTTAFGNFDTEDVAYGNGKLFVADGTGKEVYVVSPGANGRFDGVPPTGDDTVTHFDVERYGVRDAEGLGYNAATNTVIVCDRRRLLVEVTPSGAFVRSINLSFLNGLAPADVAVAPGSNNPAIQNYYIVDRMVDNNQDPNERDGRLYEITLGASANLLQNPGLEAASSGIPAVWSVWSNFLQSSELVHGKSFARKFAAADHSGATIKQVISFMQ